MAKKKEQVAETPQANTVVLDPKVMEEEEANPIEVSEESPNPEKVVVLNEDSLTEYDHKMIDKDIRFRGPLSYRYIRLIGWMCMSIMFISMILGFVLNLKGILGSVSQEQIAAFNLASDIMSYFSSMPLPLFLIANFAVILQQKNNYKKLIKTYGMILLAIYVGFIVVYYHYVIVFLMRIGEVSFAEARSGSIEIFAEMGKQNGLVVNVFVDLFACVLIMFFIDYNPKKYFQGKKIIIFRLFALIPILYEVASAILMGLMSMNNLFVDFTFSVPPEILPLIGKKPVGMIIAFVLICIYMKLREKRYIKKGGTKEGYELFLKTNRNSFKVARTMALIFILIVIVDFIATIIPMVALYVQYPDDQYFEAILNTITGFTIGKSVCLLLIVPFTLLFSYSKTHDNPELDKYVPIAGIGIVVFAMIETLFFSILF